MWFSTLLKHAPDIDWAGIAVTHADLVDADLSRAFEVVCPVFNSPQAVAELLRRCQVVLVWGTSVTPEYANYPGRIVFVSHGAGAWTRYAAAPWPGVAHDFVAVSHLAAAALPDHVRPTTIVIPNGFEPERLATDRSRREIRAEWGLTDETVAVGYCGRFSSEKNPLAAARAVAARPRFTPVYQCPPRTREEARSQVQALVPNSVFPTGPVAEFYRGIDVLVMASAEEGFCLSILEAWAAGVPVVSTAVGIVPEAEVQYGPLVAPIPHEARPCQLGKAIDAALSLEHQAVVERARRVAWERYSAQRMGSAWSRRLHAIVDEADLV